MSKQNCRKAVTSESYCVKYHRMPKLDRHDILKTRGCITTYALLGVGIPFSIFIFYISPPQARHSSTHIIRSRRLRVRTGPSYSPRRILRQVTRERLQYVIVRRPLNSPDVTFPRENIGHRMTTVNRAGSFVTAKSTRRSPGATVITAPGRSDITSRRYIGVSVNRPGRTAAHTPRIK